VVTRATVRLRLRPAVQVVAATLLPAWEAGLAAAREIVQQGVPLTLLRLSDAPETEVAMAVGLAGHVRAAPVVRRWLRLRGIGTGACMMLCGAAGGERVVRRALRRARAVLRRHGGAALGAGAGRHWLADRFRHPYLRDSLLDLGVATDTLETAAPWSRLPGLAERVGQALVTALASEDERVAALCHLSHPYRDGSSLYFTFFFRCPADPDAAVARWARIKRAATDAIMAGGGTLTHHHGVGSWHAPWFEREVGPDGVRLLRTAAAALDPGGIVNPHVLLDPIDRLEV
jgi:alkyldihydroxyacetonephosphate synthase